MLVFVAFGWARRPEYSLRTWTLQGSKHQPRASQESDWVANSDGESLVAVYGDE